MPIHRRQQPEEFETFGVDHPLINSDEDSDEYSEDEYLEDEEEDEDEDEGESSDDLGDTSESEISQSQNHAPRMQDHATYRRPSPPDPWTTFVEDAHWHPRSSSKMSQQRRMWAAALVANAETSTALTNQEPCEGDSKQEPPSLLQQHYAPSKKEQELRDDSSDDGHNNVNYWDALTGSPAVSEERERGDKQEGDPLADVSFMATPLTPTSKRLGRPHTNFATLAAQAAGMSTPQAARSPWQSTASLSRSFGGYWVLGESIREPRGGRVGRDSADILEVPGSPATAAIEEPEQPPLPPWEKRLGGLRRWNQR